MNRKLLILLLFSANIFSQNKSTPTGFIENKGQITDQKSRPNNTVKYLLNTPGLNVQLRQNGFSYDVYQTQKHPLQKKEVERRSTTFFSNHDTLRNLNYSLEYQYHRIDIDFENSNPDVKLIAEGKSTDYDNYYNIPSKPDGVLEVHKYQKVTYQNIYPNIDVVFFIPEDKQKAVEYNFIIKPNGKIEDIQMKFNGVKTELADNKIKMDVRFGQMEETLPLSWTENDKKEVAINYKKIKNNVYGLESSQTLVGKKLIIDPTPIRLWGTYYGGVGYEFAQHLEIDTNNNIYLSGITESSTNIATAGSFQSSFNGENNHFLTKMDPNGVRIWGGYYSFLQGVFKLDHFNNIYMFGQTIKDIGIPSANCFQSTKDNYYDGFLVKLNNSGYKEWGTYYGGNNNEFIYSACFDIDNNIYIVGETNSTNSIFASANAHQSTNNSQGGYTDAFIAKFDSNGNRIWGTFYGGERADHFGNINLSDDGFLYCSGGHNSKNNIATPGSYQPQTIAGYGGMIVKFNLNGQRIWGTYIFDESTIFFNAIIKGDYLYFSGETTNKTDIGTKGTFLENYQTKPSKSQLDGERNSYIAKFNIQTQQKVWGTYFIERINNLDINQNNEIYFAFCTVLDSGITTPDAYMPTKDIYSKCYLNKLNSSGQRIWGTYYGGNDRGEQSGFLRIDLNNDIYLCGSTTSTSGIATIGAHQTTLGSNTNEDCFLAKFKDCQSATYANSNSPICIGENINLTASGGTNYSWTGPNGYISNQQNPTINTANTTHSGKYSCSITGTGNCDNTITIDVLVGDNTKPVPNIPSLPMITGDCHTTISTIPTATDNCVGTINATTTDPLSYSIPGNYTIHWKYDDGNANIETQTQNVVITPVNLPTLNSPQKFCIQENATVNNIQIKGQNIKWYDSNSGTNMLPNSTTLQDKTTYYATQTVNGCESTRVPVTITIQNTQAPTGADSQTFCSSQNVVLEDISVNGSIVQWYDSATNNIALSPSTPIADNGMYYITQTVKGCESANRFIVKTHLTSTLNANDFEKTICDSNNDGRETVQFSDFDSNLISASGNTFDYYASLNGAQNELASEKLNTNHVLTSGLNVVYVRITSPQGCFQIVQLSLNLIKEPILNIPDEITLCEKNSIKVNAGSGFDSYLWSNGQKKPSVVITQPGNYSVTITKNNGLATCAVTRDFTVVTSNGPTITAVNTVDWTDNQNSITITAGGLGDYEYSLNNIDFQDSNAFTGLLNGNYTLYVRDKKGCGTNQSQVLVLNYPKFFTPNGDDFHDAWSIPYSPLEPNFEVKIFDRYGKVLKTMNNTEAWDGTYNGSLIPSDDYWFVVTRKDGQIHKGHFSLKR